MSASRPFVLGMAGAALAGGGILHAAVKIGARAYVLGDVFMAVQAQRSLSHLVAAPVVTIAAGFLLLDMRLAHFAGQSAVFRPSRPRHPLRTAS